MYSPGLGAALTPLGVSARVHKMCSDGSVLRAALHNETLCPGLGFITTWLSVRYSAVEVINVRFNCPASVSSDLGSHLHRNPDL